MLTMNSPKVFLAALFICAVLLYTATSLIGDHASTTINATVNSQTLTQSLDGHRRYLNVITEHQQQLLIQAPANIDCPEKSQVVIKEQPALLSDVKSYQLIRCLAAQ